MLPKPFLPDLSLKVPKLAQLSPVLPSKREVETVCLCTDFRALSNIAAYDDAYPLPSTEGHLPQSHVASMPHCYAIPLHFNKSLWRTLMSLGLGLAPLLPMIVDCA